jgi:hypothetical protein
MDQHPRSYVMSMQSSRSFRVPVGLLACAFFFSPTAWGKCGCPGDGNWGATATSGLGESFPEAVDLAVDAAWQVYEFERDGVRYVQVNDTAGNVRAAAGRIGGTAWVMPIGTDADRVAVPGDALPVGVPSLLYRGSDVEVVRYQDGSVTRWLIRPLSATE